jgi:hypothetical protein
MTIIRKSVVLTALLGSSQAAVRAAAAAVGGGRIVRPAGFEPVPVATPTLSEWGMLLLAAGLVALALISLRRKGASRT